MWPSFIRTAGLLLFALLAFPSVGHASIWDYIWKLSGPSMIGVVLHCEYDPKEVAPPPGQQEEYSKVECRALDKLFAGNVAPRTARRVWLSLDTGFYVSTGNNHGGIDFKAGTTKMIMFEPMLETRSTTVSDGNLSFHHGLLGLSYDILFGNESGTFDKAGMKFRPLGVTYKKINFSYILRVYPNGFTTDEFIGPRIDGLNRDTEAVHSVTFGFLW